MSIPTDMERPNQGRHEEGTSRGHSRLLQISLAILALVAVVLGSLVVANLVTRNEAAPPADVKQVIDDYLAAWENRDLDALKGLVTDDFFINEQTFELGEPQDTTNWTVESLGIVTTNNRTTELVGEMTGSGDGPWVVSVGQSSTSQFARWDGTSNYVIVDDAGTKKISRVYWVGVTKMLETPNFDR